MEELDSGGIHSCCGKPFDVSISQSAREKRRLIILQNLDHPHRHHKILHFPY
jgi:hypothetical protein